MKQTIILLISLFLLSACNRPSSFIELYYFNRIKYSFSNDNSEKQHNYMCEKGKSEEDAHQRALKTHQYMQSEIQRLTQEYNETPSFIDEGGDTMYGDALDKMDEGVNKIMSNIETQFQCMYIGES